MKKIEIIIADDHALIREGWVLLLNHDPRFMVVSVCSSGEEAIEQAKKLHPDVVIMDITMPGLNGIEATQLIHAILPKIKVLGVSQHAKSTYAFKMIKEGAKGYLTKSSSKNELFKAICEVYAGRQYVCEEIKNLSFNETLTGKNVHGWFGILSNRELQIIKLIKDGYTSRDIGGVLNLSGRTVEVHRYNILKKLALKNTASLINYIDMNDMPV